jgi:hypothetical protein
MPNSPDQWLDPRTLIAIGGLVIGILGFLFGIFRDRWSRRESRLESLGKILQPLVRATQDLMKANNCRRKCEQLKHSFREQPAQVILGVERLETFPQRTPEVVERVNSMIDEYGQLLSSSEKHFRDAEAEFGARHFRFPTAVAKQLKELQEAVAELGRLINEGMFDKADLQLVTFRDQHRRISATARGWRLADPFEGFLRHFRKPENEDEERISEFDLTEKEMNGVLELLHKRVTTQRGNTFAVHPPQKLLDDMSILQSDTIIDELKDSVFSVVFQDGTAKMLTLPELMAFVFNLITFAVQTAELNKMVQAANPNGPREYHVSFQFSMQQIMTPEMVKVLLSKITFSDTPSDADDVPNKSSH